MSILPQYIPKVFNCRRFVIGDIHGCSKTLKILLEEKVKLTPKDQLFILGDFIGKGPKSKKVLNYILKLIDNKYNIYPICGNHENILINLANVNNKHFRYHLKRIKAENLAKNNQLKPKYLQFLQSLPLYYITDDFLFIHHKPKYKKDKSKFNQQLLKTYNYLKQNKYIHSNTQIIQGHNPTNLGIIIEQVINKENLICLDNGVNYIKKHSYYNYKLLGNLCCLNIDTYELIIQPNIENISNSTKNSILLTTI